MYMYQTAIPMISPLDVSCMPGLLPDVIQYDPAIHFSTVYIKLNTCIYAMYPSISCYENKAHK